MVHTPYGLGQGSSAHAIERVTVFCFDHIQAGFNGFAQDAGDVGDFRCPIVIGLKPAATAASARGFLKAAWPQLHSATGSHDQLQAIAQRVQALSKTVG